MSSDVDLESLHLWRLSNAPDLSNASRNGGWWAPPDVDVVLLDESPVAAICARMALVEAGHLRELPRGYRLLAVSVPAQAVLRLPPPATWRTERQAARAFVQAWLSAGRTPLLQVPTLAGGAQYLLHAAHPQAQRCRIAASWSAPFAPHADALDEVLTGAAWLATTPETTRVAN